MFTVGQGANKGGRHQVHPFNVETRLFHRGDDAVDHLFDGRVHTEIPVERIDSGATHGAGCTHSATLAAWLARGLPLAEAARAAAEAATAAVRNGLASIGSGDGPVDVLNLKGRP